MPLVNFQNQTIDAEGRPVPARVTVYYRGTLTLATPDIFLRSNGGGIANPFNADDGYVSFWANPGVYDVRMEDQSTPARFAARTVGFDAVSGDVGGVLLKQAAPDLMRQTVPLGAVIDWWRPQPPSGTALAAVPDGFEICDGRTIAAGSHDFFAGSSITLPDLRNKFIIGADTPDAPINYRTGQTQITGNYRGDAQAGGTGEGNNLAPGIRGQAGSNANKDFSHSHTVNAHRHRVDSHSHSMRDHYHTVNNHGHGAVAEAPGMSLSGNHGHNISGQGYATSSRGRSDGNLQGFYVYNLANVALSIDGPGDHSHTVHNHGHGLVAESPGTTWVSGWSGGNSSTGDQNPLTGEARNTSDTSGETGTTPNLSSSMDLRPSHYGLLKIMKVRRA